MFPNFGCSTRRFSLLHLIFMSAALLISSTAGFSTVSAELFKINKNAADVRFVCGAGLAGIKGRFPEVYGRVEVREGRRRQARAQVTIKTASITTGTPFLDGQLRGRQFFYVARYPAIKFEGRTTTTSNSSRARMTGTLSVRGIEKQISLPVTYIKKKSKTSRKHSNQSTNIAPGDVFQAKFSILRSDYGMGGWEFIVPNKCEINIKASLRK